MTRLSAVVVACALALVATAADARPRHKIARHALTESSQCLSDNNGRTTCQGAANRASESRMASATHRRSGVTNSRECLTSDTRAVLERGEGHFGVKFTLVSTCRPGARIAGTNHISEHDHGRAVDLLVPRGTSKAEVVRWFYQNAKGVTMIYRNMAHVHFDTGPYHKLACGGCGAIRHVRLAHLR